MRSISEVDALPRQQEPGDVDIPEVQDIKRIIRESRGGGGHRAMGLTREQRALPQPAVLPDGQGEKDPIGPADVAIIRELLEELQARDHLRRRRPVRSARHAPHVQGGDRHARSRRLVAGGAARPEVWLYRGAWQEWPITEATCSCRCRRRSCGSRSRRSSSTSRRRIRRRFPGQDDREFWQRVEERNKGTAAELDRLGLAEYFAMEAYVVER